MNSVELIGHYGDDVAHALSAWTSTWRELTSERHERIGKMLKELAQNGHHTPFEKSALHFLVKCDVASHIHLLKHRIGVSVNAESARYKEFKGDYYHVPDDWPREVQQRVAHYFEQSSSLYHSLVAELAPIFGRKRAKESARFVLPYGHQLTSDVMFNFRSFVHFYKLRAASDAQREIRDIATKMLELIRGTASFNLSLEAFGL